MTRSKQLAKSVSSLLTAAVCSALLGLAGCQPEGTGTVKAPGPRGDDTNLGRPFGNAPELPKKKPAAEKSKKEVPEPANPRL
jgi:hypothetical protein